MNLRIVRKSEWVRDPSAPLMIGGPPPNMILKHTDTLQFEDNEGRWANVEIHQLPIPENPNEKRRREQRAQHTQGLHVELRAAMTPIQKP